MLSSVGNGNHILLSMECMGMYISVSLLVWIGWVWKEKEEAIRL